MMQDTTEVVMTMVSAAMVSTVSYEDSCSSTMEMAEAVTDSNSSSTV